MPLLTEVFKIKEGPDQVNPKVEKLMNSSEVSQFVEADWLALSLMALDQAGISLQVQNKIEKMATEDMPEAPLSDKKPQDTRPDGPGPVSK